MIRWRVILTGLAVALAPACGRIGFAPDEDLTGDGALGPSELTISIVGAAAASGRVTSPAGIDCPGTCEVTLARGTTLELVAATTSADVYLVGWTGACNGPGSTCQLTVDGDATVVASFEAMPNRVFVTSTTVTGAFGGVDAADTVCEDAALAAGLTGTFVAWISDANVHAIDRITSGRGWITIDGRPVADTVQEMVAGRMFNPINVDELGDRVPMARDVWTGGDEGQGGAVTCNNWTTTSINGTYQPTGDAMLSLTNRGSQCSEQKSLLCFETGRDGPVAPVGQPGRVAFVTRQDLSTAAGLAAFDAACQGDAVAAGLPGSFRAAIATSTTSIASRFTIDQRDVVRPDGTKIADAAAFFASSGWSSFANQRADGTYVADVFFTGAESPTVTGTLASTCNDWTSPGEMTAPVGANYTVRRTVWSDSITACQQMLPVLCVEE